VQATQNSDYYAWTLQTAERLRDGQVSEVDLNDVAQELEDMGKAQRQALGSHLKVLIVHLLRWRYQPSFCGVSWRLSITNARDEIAGVRIPEPMEDYIVALIAATRRPAELDGDLAKYIQVGASPRGSLALDKVSRAHAWLQGRDQVTPDDIRAVINDCLRHRIVPSFEAQADGVTSDDIIAMVVKLVAVI